MTPCPRCFKGVILTNRYREEWCPICGHRPSGFVDSPQPAENRRHLIGGSGALPRGHVRHAPVTDRKRG